MGVFQSSQENPDHTNVIKDDDSFVDQNSKLKNKQKGPNHPSSSYATQVDTFPSFTNEALKAMRNRGIKPSFQIDHETPLYLIKQKNAYYQGEWNKGIPEGKGSVLTQDGHYYQGTFNEGEASTEQGIIVYPNGTIYQGEISRSTLNGRGKLTFPNSSMIYQGQFKDGMPHGQGQERYSDGSYYEGEFYRGKKNGAGKYQCAEFQYVGDFTEGHMTGRGVMKNFKDEGVFQGNFKNGLKEGNAVYKTKYGTYQGNFIGGKMQGEGKFIYNSNKIYVGSFVNNKMDGKGKMVYDNGQVVRGQWKNDHNIRIDQVDNDPAQYRAALQGTGKNSSLFKKNVNVNTGSNLMNNHQDNEWTRPRVQYE